MAPHSWGFWITHNDAPQSVGLLWTSGQLVAETSTWQHTTDKRPCSRWIRTHDPSRRAGADLRLRPRGDWDRHNQLGAQIFLICLLLFSTCFGQLCAHHHEKIPYLCETWYLSLYIDDCLVCRAESQPVGAYVCVVPRAGRHHPARGTTHTHSRLGYAAITLTTFISTSAVEPYL